MTWRVIILIVVIVLGSSGAADAQLTASDFSVEAFCREHAIAASVRDELSDLYTRYCATVAELNAEFDRSMTAALERELNDPVGRSWNQDGEDFGRFEAQRRQWRGLEDAFRALRVDGEALLEPAAQVAWARTFCMMRREWGLVDVVNGRDGVAIPDLFAVVAGAEVTVDSDLDGELRQYERALDDRLQAWQTLGPRWLRGLARDDAAQRAQAMQRLGRERNRLQQQIYELTQEAAARVAHGLDVVDAAAFRREFWAQSYPAWSRPGPFREVLRAIDDDLRADPIVQDALAHYAARIDAWQLRMADAFDAARQLTRDEIDERHDRLRAAWEVDDGGAAVDAIQDELGFATLLAERRVIEADAVRALGDALGAEVIERQSPVVRMLMRWAADDR